MLDMQISRQDTMMLDRLREARKSRDDCEQAFREQVSEAMANRDGHTVSAIAAAAGLSRERVYQIAQGRR